MMAVVVDKNHQDDNNDDDDDDTTPTIMRTQLPPQPPRKLEPEVDDHYNVHRRLAVSSGRRWSGIPQCTGPAGRMSMSTRDAGTPLPVWRRATGARLTCGKHRYFSIKTCQSCSGDA